MFTVTKIIPVINEREEEKRKKEMKRKNILANIYSAFTLIGSDTKLLCVLSLQTRGVEMARKHTAGKKAIISDGRTHCISDGGLTVSAIRTHCINDKGLTVSVMKDSLYQWWRTHCISFGGLILSGMKDSLYQWEDSMYQWWRTYCISDEGQRMTCCDLHYKNGTLAVQRGDWRDLRTEDQFKTSWQTSENPLPMEIWREVPEKQQRRHWSALQLKKKEMRNLSKEEGKCALSISFCWVMSN